MTRSPASALPLLLAVLGACASPPPPAPPAPPPRASAAAAWVPVRAAGAVALAEAPATVLSAPGAAAAVSAPFRARVQRVRVQPGQRVEKGEALVEVVMPEVVQAAGQAAAATLRVEAYAEQEEKLKALQAQGMARLPDVAEARTRLAEARADRLAALAVLRVAGLPAEEAQGVATQGTVWLKSPIAGMVTEVSAVLGEVAPEAAGALVRVAAEGPTRIEARLSSRPPPGATFTFVSSSGEAVAVRQVGQAPQVEAADGTTRAWFEPVADAGKQAHVLPAGTGGRLKVQGAAGDKAVLVPARALAFEGGHAVVFAKTQQGPARREVEVVGTTGVEALVRGELSEGDAVAADAAALQTAADAAAQQGGEAGHD